MAAQAHSTTSILFIVFVVGHPLRTEVMFTRTRGGQRTLTGFQSARFGHMEERASVNEVQRRLAPGAAAEKQHLTQCSCNDKLNHTEQCAKTAFVGVIVIPKFHLGTSCDYRQSDFAHKSQSPASVSDLVLLCAARWRQIMKL